MTSYIPCLRVALFLCAVSGCLSLSQNINDDSNIIGDPTFFNIDIPHARQRRQISTNDSVPLTNDTQVTELTPSGSEAATQSSINDTSTDATVTDKATTAKVATQKATIAATTKVVATTAAEEKPVTPDDDGTIHWASHNESYFDDHLYYKVKYVPPGDNPDRYWVDMDHPIANKPASLKKDSVITSANTRRAKLVTLSFPFEFYGQNITKLLITTGGFLYVGNYIHRYLAATQYIAPLMANFDPSVTANATIRSVDNGTAFTAEWRKIALADNAGNGEFTFQTTLFKDGRIVFAYQQVPIPVDKINTQAHPVRIGVADAYYNDTLLSPFSYFGLMLKKRSIYEYHKVEVNFTRVISNMAIEIIPNPTCHDMIDCHSCASSNISFDCGWCPAQRRCSSGFDRYRQSWVKDKCDTKNITVEADCNRPNIYDLVTTKAMKNKPKVTPSPSKGQPDEDEDIIYIPHSPRSQPKPATAKASHFGYGGILFVIILFIVFSVLLVWIVYAYRRPTSNSGIFLIELTSKLKRKGLGDSDIKYKYHKPENDAEHV